MQFNNLPVYEGKIIDNEDGMLCISLVDSPATESNFVAFSSEKESVQFKVANEEQRMVFGLIMGANQPIYRRDRSGYEYYIIYRPETLRLMVEKYLKNGYQNNVDRMHDFVPVEGVNMVQIFIKDTERGISPKGFEEFEDGSLFGQFHVVNDEVWEQIKDGTFKGFSLAGLFEKEATFNKQENKNIIAMKIEKIKAVLRKLLAEFGSISTDKGVITWDGDEELKEGDVVRGVDEEGNALELEDGEYTTEDKKVITLEGGVVVSIVDTDAEVAPEEEKPAEEEAPAEEEKPAEEEEKPAEEEEKPAEEEPAKEEEAPAQEEEEPAAEDKDERIANLEAEIARLEEENGALKARIKELEGESAAQPAGEEFKKVEDNMSPKMKNMVKRGYRFD